jgi:mRNA interferase RelE/StbE
MTYKIEIRPRALKFLKTLSSTDKERIKSKIQDLSNNPRNEHVIKLSGKSPDQYRTRQGDYRIIFSIHDEKLVIEIIDIDHRKDAYR